MQGLLRQWLSKQRSQLFIPVLGHLLGLQACPCEGLQGCPCEVRVHPWPPALSLCHTHTHKAIPISTSTPIFVRIYPDLCPHIFLHPPPNLCPSPILSRPLPILVSFVLALRTSRTHGRCEACIDQASINGSASCVGVVRPALIEA